MPGPLSNSRVRTGLGFLSGLALVLAGCGESPTYSVDDLAKMPEAMFRYPRATYDPDQLVKLPSSALVHSSELHGQFGTADPPVEVGQWFAMQLEPRGWSLRLSSQSPYAWGKDDLTFLVDCNSDHTNTSRLPTGAPNKNAPTLCGIVFTSNVLQTPTR